MTRAADVQGPLPVGQARYLPMRLLTSGYRSIAITDPKPPSAMERDFHHRGAPRLLGIYSGVPLLHLNRAAQQRRINRSSERPLKTGARAIDGDNRAKFC
jgi:hypothetical protein